MNMAPRGTSGWEDRLWLQDRAGAFSDSSLLVLLFFSWTSFIHFSFAHSSVRLYMGQACPNHWQLFMDAVTVTVLLCNKGNQAARDFSYLSFRFSTSIRTEFHYPLADFIEGCAPGAGPGRDSMTLTLTQNYWKMAKKKKEDLEIRVVLFVIPALEVEAGGSEAESCLQRLKVHLQLHSEF